MTHGVANIQVFSYLGRNERTMIGRVYVEDLDDWDVGSKTFEWGAEGEVSGFSLAPNGEVFLNILIIITCFFNIFVSAVYFFF